MSLLAWQWGLYPEGHRNRKNLLLHAITQPFFVAGALTLAASPFFLSWKMAASGAVAMVVVMALQWRGHKTEETPPVPFRGPLDVFARIFAEQFITFPRFVLGGGFARAWRASRRA
jgi:hypothetical protein